MRFIKVLSVCAIAVLAVSIQTGCGNAPTTTNTGAYTSPVPNQEGKTLANLLEAYNGESNASAKYLEYAKKADAEGYGKVASLFRAASRAEAIHMKNHADVITKMGGTPKNDIKLPEIKSTQENLKASIDGETYERDTMYTDFMIEARRIGNRDALRSFNFAKIAEGEHAKLYADALANLEKWKGDKQTFYVCPVCGFTTPDAALPKCPVDFTEKDKFESVS
ncbi:MAG: rubrerythrin family protein [Acidobacteria bacterium]|nr:rubrerythrin family protein [Acidobacteriota bacterium]MBK8811160.1 rubrerythrin family protein [Acidobacteriota bacterium]